MLLIWHKNNTCQKDVKLMPVLDFFLTKVIQNFTWDSNKIEILLILFYVLSVKRKSSLSVGKQ